jgi:tetratricopeptide (TPR) repeat protein
VRRVTDRNWRALLRQASQLRAAGRIPEAILAYRELLAANPELADSWFNLGWLERQARQFEQSLQSYQRAIDAGVAQPEEAHLNRAAIYSEYLHRPRDAQRELEAALARNAGSSTRPLVGLQYSHSSMRPSDECGSGAPQFSHGVTPHHTPMRAPAVVRARQPAYRPPRRVS